jgi:hypothetical protein
MRSSRFLRTLNVIVVNRLGIRNGKRTASPASSSRQCLRTNSSKPASDTIATFAGTRCSRRGACADGRKNTRGPSAVRRKPSEYPLRPSVSVNSGSSRTPP